jgi:hypothetical protein
MRYGGNRCGHHWSARLSVATFHDQLQKLFAAFGCVSERSAPDALHLLESTDEEWRPFSGVLP